MASAKHQAEEAKEGVEEVSDKTDELKSKPFFRRFARAGIGSRAVIYLLLAYIAFRIALSGHSSTNASGEGALSEIAHQPGGSILLLVLALGLLAYGAWRVSMALGHDHEIESTSKQAAKRAGFSVAALVYIFLAVRAVGLAFSSSSGGGGASAHPSPYVGIVLRWPGGPFWVGLAGVGLGASGVGLAAWGALHDYSEVVSPPRAGTGKASLARATGIAGEVARGLMLALAAVYLVIAAVRDKPSAAKSMGEALTSLDRLSYGPPLLVALAVGLVCFAAYSALEAAYRDV